LGSSLERLLKILIPLGGIERSDKLHYCLHVGRLSDHQNFSTANCMPNAICGKRKATPKVTPIRLKRKNSAVNNTPRTGKEQIIKNPLRSWMELFVNQLQPILVYMRVNLCGRDIGVAQ